MPSGAVRLDFGDGTAWYLPISSLSYAMWYVWSDPGTYTVTATGEGNCAGTASTSVTVTGESADANAAVGAPAFLFPSGDRSSPGRASPVLSTESDVSLPPAGAEASASLSDPLFTTATMTLDLSSTGTGAVTSDPSGLGCSGHDVSCTGSFRAGQAVTLTAAAASGSTFTGWAGACSGTSATCTVTAADGLLVVALFWTPPPTVTAYYHVDLLGSVRATIDQNGTLVERHDYLAYGEDTGTLQPAGADPKRFLGKDSDGGPGSMTSGRAAATAGWGGSWASIR